MAALKLVIGDKNWSSWSLRPWFILKQARILFEEIQVRLRQPDTRDQILRVSPSGKVPALLTADGVIWDSLAISEYLAECFPEKQLWPEQRHARAVARSVAAEMHAGFPNLRNEMPMDCLAKISKPSVSDETAQDIARIETIWRQCRADFGASGPFLFGHFTITDAMYAPVVARFATYDVKLDKPAQRYAGMIWALPAFEDWRRGAREEQRLRAGI